jgi:acetylglutamate kinase
MIVKLGGTTIAEDEQVLRSVAALAADTPVILVHGGGKRVTEWSERLGLETRFESGLRVTDASGLEVVEAILRGVVNTELVATLRELGADAVGVSGVDGGMLVGDRVAGRGMVVTVTDVRRDLPDALLAAGLLPVVAPLALDADGTVCNANADDVAAGLARGLDSPLLVLLTDVEAVRGADGQPIDRLTASDAERLIAEGVVAGGMIPKVRAAIDGVRGRRGVAAVIARGDIADVLAGGRGTRISADA